MLKNSISFLGLPGAGKTSIINSLCGDFSDFYLRIPTFSKSKRLFLFLFFVLINPLISFRFFVLILQNNTSLWKYLIHLVSVCFASHSYVFLVGDNKRKFIIDEGLYQRLLSILPRKENKKFFYKMILLINKISKGVVFIEGGNFSRFFSEPDRMINKRNKLGKDYINSWSSDIVFNINLMKNILSQMDDVLIVKEFNIKEVKEKSLFIHNCLQKFTF